MPRATIYTNFLLSFSIGCDGLGDVYYVTVNNNGIQAGVDEGGVKVPLPEPKPYPYTDSEYPFGDNVTFSNMSAGWNHICAIRLDGVVECRGDDEYGETHPPPGTFITVYAGYQGTCGKKSNGTFECWGFDPGYDDWSRPTGSQWPSNTTLVDLSMGRRWMCGRDPSNFPLCWAGYNSDILNVPAVALDSIEIGVGSACGLISGSDQISCWGNNSAGQLDIPTGYWLDVSFSQSTPCGVRTDGSLECWGSEDPPFFFQMPSGRDFIKVEVKGDRLCGLHEEGDISCYSNGRQEWRTMVGEYIDMAVGQTFTCGRTDEGYIRCMGLLPEPMQQNR